MKDNILEILNKIASYPDQLDEDFQKIRALYSSTSRENEDLVLELLKGQGYSRLQAKVIAALLAEKMNLDDRIAYHLIDEVEIQIESIDIGMLTKEMLESNENPIAKLLNLRKDNYISYPQNPNIEISLEERECYFYLSFVADQMPFCLIAEATYVEGAYQRSHAIEYLLSINLLSERPPNLEMLAPANMFLEIKPEIGDHLLDWLSFNSNEEERGLEMMVESMGNDQWGIGIGFYNEERQYISIFDLEVKGGDMLLNQDDLKKLKEAYPHYLKALAYKKEDQLDIEEIKQIWTYNLLKNYL